MKLAGDQHQKAETADNRKERTGMKIENSEKLIDDDALDTVTGGGNLYGEYEPRNVDGINLAWLSL